MRRAVLLGAAAVAVASAWLAAASLLFLFALGFMGTYPWPDRLWMWARYAIEAPPNAIVHRWLVITGVAAAVPFIVVIGVAVQVIRSRASSRRNPIYGETEFANRRQMAANAIATKRRPF